MRILIFKTAATGLWNKQEELLSEKQPWMLELAWILYEKDTVLNEFSSIINVPQHVRFNEQAVKVNGITRELSDQGRPAKEVITKFKEVFSQVDLWAVYTSFDYDLMLRECRLNDIDDDFFFAGKKWLNIIETVSEYVNIPNDWGKPKFLSMKDAWKHLTGEDWGVSTSLETVRNFKVMLDMIGLDL